MIDQPLVKLIFDVILLQSLVPEDLIRDPDEVKPTVPPPWNPVVFFSFPSGRSTLLLTLVKQGSLG